MVEVNNASSVRLASAARAAAPLTPPARVTSDSIELTNAEPSARTSDSTTVARPPIRSRTTSPSVLP